MPTIYNKRYLAALFVALLCCISLCAQDSFVPEQPNFAEIAQEISNPSSPYYYPTTTLRSLKNITLTTQQ